MYEYVRIPLELRAPTSYQDYSMSIRPQAQRCGVDMTGMKPEELAQAVFKKSAKELDALRSGAFFVLLDDYSATSDAFKMLTTTNIAVPLEQCFPGPSPPTLVAISHPTHTVVRTASYNNIV